MTRHSTTQFSSACDICDVKWEGMINGASHYAVMQHISAAPNSHRLHVTCRLTREAHGRLGDLSCTTHVESGAMRATYYYYYYY